MDLVALRTVVARHIGTFATRTHAEIDIAFERLGLDGPDGSRRARVQQALDGLTDEHLQPLADRVLEEDALPPVTRFEIEEILWDGWPGVPIVNRRTRHRIADALTAAELYTDPDGFMALLDRWWVLDSADPFAAAAAMWGDQPVASLRADIQQHVLRNSGDWNSRQLFERLGAFTCSDRRFCLFLEGLVSSEVSPDEAHQRAVAESVNAELAQSGATLQEAESVDGYPRFVLSSDASPARTPKNIIFASVSKPEIRLSSAVDNDVEIVNDADVLIYTRAVGAEGLTWNHLQDWWAADHRHDPTTARTDLYRRLQASLPEEPPQRNFFRAYHVVCGARAPQLPALLPEVWLHWDPRTVRERGVDALLRFRMDFLLLLPHGRRVVIEVDGQHHYATGRRPSPERYAAMVAADRDLKLSNYEVYRFGAQELDTNERAEVCVGDLLRRLFPRYGVAFATT